MKYSFVFSQNNLCLTSLWANSADDKLIFFFQKTEFDISCKLSPVETICMKRQIMFSGENQEKK